MDLSMRSISLINGTSNKNACFKHCKSVTLSSLCKHHPLALLSVTIAIKNQRKRMQKEKIIVLLRDNLC
jgi:hypothetical protein